MSEKLEQKTQKLEKQEETQDTVAKGNAAIINNAVTEDEVLVELDQDKKPVEETEQLKENVDEDMHMDDADYESEDNEKVNEEVDLPVVIQDYLDPSILDIKVVSESDLDQYKEEFVSDKLHDQYADSFSDIREKEVVTGTVVGITDRDVLIDIGFKAEGIIHRTEFKELPEPGQKIDVFIYTFEDRKGNIILSKEKADFQKRWTEIRNCFENEELITGLITRRI